MPDYHLAQFNIARMKAAQDDPIMADFMAGLDAINTLGSQQPGFVWLYETHLNEGEVITPYDDHSLIVNMTVWEDIDSLYQFAYYSQHVDYFRRRAEWFVPLGRPSMVLWWIPAGQLPTVMDGVQRLDYLTEHSTTPFAFTFKQRFTPQEAASYIAQMSLLTSQ